MLSTVVLGSHGIDLDDLVAVADGAPIALDPEAASAVARCADALQHAIDDGTAIYGVTTGYGTAATQRIAPDQRTAVQLGTIRSHACGTGPLLDRRAARSLWIAKAASIATARTGASLALLEQLLAVLNHGLAPAVPEIGSLGASGDLVPSGHAGLPLIGEGELLADDGLSVDDAESTLTRLGVAPLAPGPRDGLSLVNGTAATVAIGAAAVVEARIALDNADALAAAGIEASFGHLPAFDDEVAGARGSDGALHSARNVRAGTAGAAAHAFGAQGLHDPYSWRCVPAVHGAARDAHAVADDAVRRELRGCSDNPLVDVGPDGTAIVRSGGNFHGAPLGLPLDHLTRGLGEVAALSSRRTAQLLSGRRGAPAGLTPIEAGGNGLTQLLATATALVLELRGVPSATGNWLPVDEAEDHTSNATTAARNTRRAVALLTTTLACEAIVVTAHADLAAVDPKGIALQQLTTIVRAHLEAPTADVRLDRALGEITTTLTKSSVY